VWLPPSAIQASPLPGGEGQGEGRLPQFIAPARLRDSGEYDKIADGHMLRFWTAQDRK